MYSVSCTLVDQVSFSIHPSIKNKPSSWAREYASNWEKKTGSLEDLRKYVMNGSAFVAASMTGPNRTSAAFESSSLAVVDVDHGLTVDEFLKSPLAAKAAWVYTTTSHDPSNNKERFRVIFRLPKVITDPDLYKEIVTVLVKQTNADEACTDCCRTFYGNDNAQQPLINDDAVLGYDIIEEAKKALVVRRNTYERRKEDIDDHSIQLAIYCLENIITPTADGERDRFVKITVSASAGGDEIFPYWSDWASRCHHGSGSKSKQSTERYFRTFHGTSLATIFWEATNCDPDWRSNIPSELKTDTNHLLGYYGTTFAGYEHSAFLGDDEDDGFGEDLVATTTTTEPTQGLFGDMPWQRTTTIEPEAADEFDDDDVEPEGGDAPARGRPGENQVDRVRQLMPDIYPGLRLNVMNQQLEFGPKNQARPIHDPTLMYLEVSHRANTVFPKTLVFDVASEIGYLNRYHPVKKYLETVAANTDECPYFDRLATELLGVPSDPLENPIMRDGSTLADVILKRFLIGAVARVIDPGCVHDWMPVLIGSQNCGKSTFFSYLTPPNPMDGTYPWVTTMQQGIDYLKDKPHALHAGFIVVMDEFERYTKRKYSEELKNLVSVGTDRSAKKYENEKSYPRAFVLAGATNSTDFLSDPSGNRRFLPIKVVGKVPSKENPAIKIIDLDRLKKDRDSIWVSAYRHYEDHPQHVFTSAEISYISDYADSFTRDQPYEVAVKEVLKRHTSGYHQGRPYITLAEMFRELDIPITQQSQMSRNITDCMTREGCEKKKIKKNGEQMRVWIKT